MFARSLDRLGVIQKHESITMMLSVPLKNRAERKEFKDWGLEMCDNFYLIHIRVQFLGDLLLSAQNISNKGSLFILHLDLESSLACMT